MKSPRVAETESTGHGRGSARKKPGNAGARHLLSRRNGVVQSAALRPKVEAEPHGVVPGSLGAKEVQDAGNAGPGQVRRPATVRRRLKPGQQLRRRAGLAGGGPSPELAVVGGVDLYGAALRGPGAAVVAPHIANERGRPAGGLRAGHGGRAGVGALRVRRVEPDDIVGSLPEGRKVLGALEPRDERLGEVRALVRDQADAEGPVPSPALMGGVRHHAARLRASHHRDAGHLAEDGHGLVAVLVVHDDHAKVAAEKYIVC